MIFSLLLGLKKKSHTIMSKRKELLWENVTFSCFPILRLLCGNERVIEEFNHCVCEQTLFLKAVAGRRHADKGDQQFSPERYKVNLAFDYYSSHEIGPFAIASS